MLPLLICRYNRTSGQVLSVPTQSAQPPDVTVCNTFNMDPDDQIPILEGDVYAINMVSRVTGLPVLAAQVPGSGRQLFRDTRDFVDVSSSLELRRNQLQAEDIGVHLFADIGK